LVAIGAIAIVVTPVIINGIAVIANGGINIINSIKHKNKIKKGLKDGSILEINGEYYEVHVDENEA
jgi:hypothetical protein